MAAQDCGLCEVQQSVLQLLTKTPYWTRSAAAASGSSVSLALLLKEMLALGLSLPLLCFSLFEIESHWGKVIYVEFLTHRS